MKTYLMSLGYDVWSEIENGYTAPKIPVDTNGKRFSNNNYRAKNVILYGLEKSVYTKVMHCASTKEMWDKLQKIMKEMTRSREQSYKFIEDNLRLSR
jgi:hypothetical protein